MIFHLRYRQTFELRPMFQGRQRDTIGADASIDSLLIAKIISNSIKFLQLTQQHSLESLDHPKM